MPEETASAGQPQSVPGSGLADLLDDEPETGIPEETPEPAEEPEPEETPEETEPAEPSAEEPTDETTEPDADTIPRWLEDLELTDEELASYKKRYPSAFKPDAGEDLRYLVRDRVRDHREIQAARAAAEQEAAGEPTPETTPAEVAEARKQYYASINQLVDTTLDKQALEQWGKAKLESMGVDINSTDPEIQAIVRNATKIAEQDARGAIDLMHTVMPRILPQFMEAVMPGISEMYYDAVRARSWESMRSQEAYKDLPGFGTPQWTAAVDKVLTQMPQLRDMYPNLPPNQRIAKQYQAAANLMIGQKPDVATVRAATEAGKTLQRQAQQKKTLAATMGSGRSKGQLATPKTGNDDLFGEIPVSNGRIL